MFQGTKKKQQKKKKTLWIKKSEDIYDETVNFYFREINLIFAATPSYVAWVMGHRVVWLTLREKKPLEMWEEKLQHENNWDSNPVPQ